MSPQSQTKRDSAAQTSSGVERFSDLPVEAHIAWAGFLMAYKVVVQTVDKLTLAASNLSLAEFEILLRIEHAQGRVRFVDLSRLTLLSESRVSRRIDALESKGYVLRERGGDDGRATYAVLTPLGAKAFADAQVPFVRALEAHFLDIIPADKIKEFGELMLALACRPGWNQKAQPTD